MDSSLLVKVAGFRATLIHGDTMVLDRWLWLRRRLPRTRNGERLLDVGCGSGAFSIGAARRGYSVMGLSWDARNQRVAAERAAICGVPDARFEVLDVRRLDERADLVGAHDVVICLETIEHVLDDGKLMRDLAACLRPGGRLLLTTPNLFYHPMTAGDMGPFTKIEDGEHVRRGYSRAMLEECCRQAGLVPEAFSSCSGYFSQKITWLFRTLNELHPAVGWAAILPLRFLPPLFDGLVHRVSSWPPFSIGLEAYKPRYPELRH